MMITSLVLAHSAHRLGFEAHSWLALLDLESGSGALRYRPPYRNLPKMRPTKATHETGRDIVVVVVCCSAILITEIIVLILDAACA